MHPVARTIKVDKITVVRNNFTRYFITFSVQSRRVSAIYWPSSGDFSHNTKYKKLDFATYNGCVAEIVTSILIFGIVRKIA
jgi:hypothetical protein